MKKFAIVAEATKRMGRAGVRVPPHRSVECENAAYRELLNKHGQPCNANPAAKAAFLTRFRYRSWPSISAHPNKFNLDEYKEWQGGDKGKWVGFQWQLLGD